MYIEVIAFFVIFHSILAPDTSTTISVENVSETRKLKLTKIQQRVDLMQTRIDWLDTILQQQLVTQRNGLKKEMTNLEESLSAEPFLLGYSHKFSNQEMCPNSCANLPDLCTTFTNQKNFICECGPRPNNTQQTTTQTSPASTDTTPTTTPTSTPSTATPSTESTTTPTTSTESTTPSTTTTPTTSTESTTPSTTTFQTTSTESTTPSTTTTPTTSLETTTKSGLPTSCEEAFNQTGEYGETKIQCGGKIFSVICLKGGDTETGLPDDPNVDQWLVIQRRRDDSENFNRNWADYKKGFGDRDSDFWMGLDMIHELTRSLKHQLWIKLKTFEGEARSGIYTDFGIGNEYEKYVLKSLGNFQSKISDFRDSLTEKHLNQKFTTWDVDNDNKAEYNCAELYNGGWWYNKCHDSHLNGKYLNGLLPERDPLTNISNRGHGITWVNWKWRLYSYKYAHMAIKPNMQNTKSFSENYCS